MRKSPTFSDRICELCGKQYTPTGSLQKYCDKCKPVTVKNSKIKYEKKKFPNRKPKTKCTDSCCVCGGKFMCHVDGKPYCNKHYQSMILYGQPYGKPRKSKNVFSIKDGVLYITTMNGETIISDPEELDKLQRYSWCVSKTGYAVANINNKVTKLHRYILGLEEHTPIVDHMNHDKLDNRKANLRICSQHDNSKNASAKAGNKYPGVSQKANGRYRARITVNRKEICIGTFDTFEDAVNARIKAEYKYCGEFGYYNSTN